MAKLFANSGDPDQTPRSMESDLGLHCLLITLLRVFWLQWDKQQTHILLGLIHFFVKNCVSGYSYKGDNFYLKVCDLLLKRNYS